MLVNGATDEWELCIIDALNVLTQMFTDLLQ